MAGPDAETPGAVFLSLRTQEISFKRFFLTRKKRRRLSCLSYASRLFFADFKACLRKNNLLAGPKFDSAVFVGLEEKLSALFCVREDHNTAPGGEHDGDSGFSNDWLVSHWERISSLC